jgi:6-phosphogluconolactonase
MEKHVSGSASDMGLRRQVRVLPEAGDLPGAAAEEFVAALAAPVPPAAPGAAGGTAAKPLSVLLSGGSTPRALYQLLADPAAPYRQRVAWGALHFFWGDERHVPPGDAQSNYRMAREAMLDQLPVSAAQVHRIAGEEPDAAVAAALYERELIAHFALQGERDERGPVRGEGAMFSSASAAQPAEEELDWPRFDLVLLGLGEEGHTASLFPGSPVLDERRRLTAAPWVAAQNTFRITVTPPVLNHAAVVMFVVSGEAKAAAVAAVIEGERQPAVYPAQVVAPVAGKLIWLLDRAAASRLRSTV